MSTKSMCARLRSSRSCFESPRRIGAACVLALTALAAPVWAQDADGDGVADASDTYPCDPQLAGEAFAPAEGVWGGLTFEDEWPSAGDQDLNDVILDHNTHLRTDAAGRAVRITSRYQVSALGGSARMGLGLHLPVPRTSIAAATITDRNGQRALTASALDAEATFFAYDDLSTLFPGQTPPFNVVAGGSVVPGQLITIDVTLNTATQVSISAAPFDVFVFRSNDVTRETHRTPYAGTSRLAAILFGTGDDGSAPAGISWTRKASRSCSNVQTASRFAARVLAQGHPDHQRSGPGHRGFEPDGALLSKPQHQLQQRAGGLELHRRRVPECLVREPLHHARVGVRV